MAFEGDYIKAPDSWLVKVNKAVANVTSDAWFTDALQKRNLNIIFLLKNKLRLLALATAIFLSNGLDCNRLPSLNRATSISRALDRAVVITIANRFDDIDEFFTVAATVLTFLHSVNTMANAALLDAFATLATAKAGATAFASALTTWAQKFASLSALELGKATAALTALAVIARLSAERAIAVDANTARVLAPISFTFSFGLQANLSSSRQL